MKRVFRTGGRQAAERGHADEGGISEHGDVGDTEAVGGVVSHQGVGQLLRRERIAGGGMGVRRTISGE